MHAIDPARFSKTLCLLSRGDDTSDGVSCLVRIYPANGVGQLVDLVGQCIVVGRDPASDVELPDDSVSRRHAMIEPTDDGYVVSDLGSANGTYVNETRIDSRRLGSGDRIRFGNHIFKFLAADCIEAQCHETIYKMM